MFVQVVGVELTRSKRCRSRPEAPVDILGVQSMHLINIPNSRKNPRSDTNILNQLIPLIAREMTRIRPCMEFINCTNIAPVRPLHRTTGP
jgi:hypothetical protein